MRQAGHTTREIVASVRKVSGIMGEITAASLRERLDDEVKDSLAVFRLGMTVLSTSIVDNAMDKSLET